MVFKVGHKQSQGARSTKLERQVARDILKALWFKAYNEGEVVLDYTGQGLEGRKLATALFTSITDFRKFINARKTQYFDVFNVLAHCTLAFNKPYVITIKRKPERYTYRTNAVLNLLKDFPELGLVTTDFNPSHKNAIADILKDVKGAE